MTRDYASFGPVRSNILDLSVYDREAGSSLNVYTKLEGGGQTDRQTDRCIADICASLHIP